MITGVVKFFKEEKGWGFIAADDGGRDVFVHAKSLSGIKLRTGDRVGFNAQPSERGRRAINVIVLLGEPETTA